MIHSTIETTTNNFLEQKRIEMLLKMFIKLNKDKYAVEASSTKTVI